MGKLIQSRPFAIFGVAMAVCILIIATLFLLRRNSLDRQAEELASAMYKGDARRLLDAAISDERVCSNLNERTVRGLWELLVKPHLDTCQFVRSEPGEIADNGTQATAGFWFLDKVGTKGGLIMVANKTDEGAKTTVVGYMFMFSCLFDDSGKFVDYPTQEVQLRKLQKYRQAMEALGVKKIMMGPGRCITWDQFEVARREQIRLREERRLHQIRP